MTESITQYHIIQLHFTYQEQKNSSLT